MINHESRRNLRNKAAMPLDGEANPLKNGKTYKNGVSNECGSFLRRFEQPKRLDFNNRPKKAQMYLGAPANMLRVVCAKHGRKEGRDRLR